jgi:hypothetical protein
VSQAITFIVLLFIVCYGRLQWHWHCRHYSGLNHWRCGLNYWRFYGL